MTFETSVFVNCPFDKPYRRLLEPLLFTIIYLGFTPRIALEEIDSGIPRIEKILALIAQSRFAIHDLSRLRAKKVGEYYRLNMPLEVGLDIGCRHFKGGKWATKRCLILETEPYRYRAAASDLSGSDIAAHGNRARELVTAVRGWLNNQARLRAPGPSAILGALLDFRTQHDSALAARGFSRREIALLPIDELISSMQDWVRVNVKTPP